MGRLTNHDHNFGPFTFAKTDWKRISFIFDTGMDESPTQGLRNNLTIYLMYYVLRISLPNFIKPYRKWVDLSNYEWATERDGVKGYYGYHNKEYGFSVIDGFFQIFYGAQTHDSSTTKSWSKFLPWTQWRHVRHSIYDVDQNLFWEQRSGVTKINDVQHWIDAKEGVSKKKFKLIDFDGEENIATTHIEEREWLFGEGWFKWLSWFRKPMVRRTLGINFDKELGPEKGSWKGGTLGHGIEMEVGENHKSAFIRYCDQEHRQKNRTFKIKYAGDL